ncbi:putative ER-golgi SNARE complex subunit [Peziza echinospora]|nr:putative ER-golgi SNARE complex subunit [Peziza echinospora]
MTSIQDRTSEFHTVVSSLSRRINRPPSTSRQPLLSDVPDRPASTTGTKKAARSEFARRAAEIGRSINSTMGKLERLAQLAKRKTLFDDKPVEISELTFVIRQDLTSLNSQIGQLQNHVRTQHPTNSKSGEGQEGEHAKNVVVMLQGKLADVGAGFKEVLEVRTKNIQASRSRTENFVSNVGGRVGDSSALQSASPLYTPQTSRTPSHPGPSPSPALLTLDPHPHHNQQMTQQQLQIMEEGQPVNTYLSARSEAIEAIERTINELGGIFGQLAQMVSEQSEMIQRIDAETEDVVTNVTGAQRELMKYWGRVSSNRWLVVKMFGVLMIFFLLWVLIS